MNRTKTPRPYTRSRRTSAFQGTGKSPVLQALEPRKLLTTLWADPLLSNGVTDLGSSAPNTFIGYIAMPQWRLSGDGPMDAGTVEERSVLVRISIYDTNLDSTATLTVRDLNGNPLFPWRGQIGEDGEVEGTDVNVSIATGDDDEDDGFWGSDDDVLFSGFGLDVGYNPGWYWHPDEVYLPDGQFDGVRQITWMEDEDPPPDRWAGTDEFDPDDPTAFDKTVVIPNTGSWFAGTDATWRGYPPFPGMPTGWDLYMNQALDDARLPSENLSYNYGGTDDRIFGNGDDANLALDPFAMPLDASGHMMDRLLDPNLNPTLTIGALGEDRFYHVVGIADDGIADFNNGIGQIILANGTATTRVVFSILTDADTWEVMDPFQEPDNDHQGVVIWAIDRTETWMPTAQGSIVIGNNTSTDWTANEANADIDTGFAQSFNFERDSDGQRMRLPEGIITLNNTPAADDFGPFLHENSNDVIGRIVIDGPLYGTNRLSGAIEVLHVGYLGGDVIIDGEAGMILVAGDAGYYETEANGPSDTRSDVTVGKTLGNFVVGHRMATSLLVEGDFDPISLADKPWLRQDNQVLEYERSLHDLEREQINGLFARGQVGYFTRDAEGGDVDYFTNNNFAEAQFIGSPTSSIRVRGTIKAEPDDGPNSDGDHIDMYALAVDGLQTIYIRLIDVNTGSDLPAILTVQDERGRILGSRGTTGQTGVVEYTPNGAGLIYIVIDGTDTLPDRNPRTYDLHVSNYAPTSLGEVRSPYGSFRYRVESGTAITTEFGSIGTIRTGQGTLELDQNYLANVILNSAGSIWNITAGGFIGGGLTEDGNVFSAGVGITAGEYIGSIISGVGRDDLGDIFDEIAGGAIVSGYIVAGSDIGKIWVYGLEDGSYGDISGVGLDGGASQTITSLTIEAGGSIGVIHAENRIYGYDRSFGTGLQLTIGGGGQVDLIEAASNTKLNVDLERAVGLFGIVDGEIFIDASGSGSNIRFVRTPYVWANGYDGQTIEIFDDEVVQFVDDSGAVYSIQMVGGRRAPGFESVALLTFQPVNFSRGSSLARIEVNLAPGADLVITNNGGFLEIGDIIVTSNSIDYGASNIIFRGDGETSVYLIRGFGIFDDIENRTSGDIIAIDVSSVDNVRLFGNLGILERSVEIGPKFLGPDLGMEVTAPGADVGGAFEIPNSAEFPVLGTDDPYLTGGAFDEYLNGLYVRFGEVKSVLIDGAVRDIIIQDTVKKIVINNDKYTPYGEFHGAMGEIYAYGNIEFIDLGDGLVSPEPGPLAHGILAAAGQIEKIRIDGEGHYIEGHIVGLGLPTLANFQQDVDYGIGEIRVSGGAGIRNANIRTNSIGAMFYAGDGGISATPIADIDRIIVKDGDVFGTTILGVHLNLLDIKGGDWDTNFVDIMEDIGRIRADAFYYTDTSQLNFINVGGDLDFLETNGGRGNIETLTVEGLGNMKRLRAFDIVTSWFEMDQKIDRVDARGKMARNVFIAGAITKIEAVGDILRNDIEVAGPMKSFRSKSGSIRRTALLIDGPSGRLDKLEARIDLSGEFEVSGPIGKVRAITGDLDAKLTTFSGDGHIKEIRAGGNMLLDLDVDGSVDKIIAGGNLGSGQVIKIRQNLKNLDVKNGTLNANIIIEGHHTGKIIAGAWGGEAALRVHGSISRVDINSDVTGTIISHSGGIRQIDIEGSLLGGEIRSDDGAIGKINIVGGDLNGNVFADEGIQQLIVRSSGGFGGDVTGMVESGMDITKFSMTGSLTGGIVMAHQNIGLLDIDGSVTSSIIGSGETLDRVTVGGNTTDSYFIAGLESLGADDALGGAALNADRHSSGTIEDISINGAMTNTVIAAGVKAGADGDYATLNGDTDLTPGLSNIDRVTVGGAATGTSLIVADTTIDDVRVNGVQRTVGDGLLTELDATPPALGGGGTTVVGFGGMFDDAIFVEADGDTVTFSLNGNGSGSFEYDGGDNILGIIFLGTDSRTSITISVTSQVGNGLVDLDGSILGDDDASLNTLNFDGNIDGTDALNIDGHVNTLILNTVNTSGSVDVGGTLNRLTITSVAAGSFNITDVNTVQISGDLVFATWISESIRNFTVSGDVLDSSIYGRDYIDSFTVGDEFGRDPTGGGSNPSYISTDGRLGSFNAGRVALSIISAGDILDRVNVTGDVIESDFLAGQQLGSDGNYGGVGTAADRLTVGWLNQITVRGDWTMSDAAAGVNPGTNFFFATFDDIGAVGISEMGNITVNGHVSGSNRGSESFAFIVAGTMGQAKANGREFTEFGNMSVEHLDVTPLPPTVVGFDIRLNTETFFVDVTFSEEIDESTVIVDTDINPLATSAFKVFEGGTAVEVNESNYELTYNRDDRQVTIEFDRDFTLNNPGVYRLEIDAGILTSSSNIALDANADGVVGDDHVVNFVLGDAGDRTVDNIGTPWDPDGDPLTDNDVTFFEATNIDLVMDDVVNGIGMKNHEVIIVETIGDHRDESSLYFPEKFDVDIYALTLEAGDIFRVSMDVFFPGSSFFGTFSLRLNNNATAASRANLEAGYIVQSTGTYYLVVAGADLVDRPIEYFGLHGMIDISNADGMFTPPIPVVAINPNSVSNDIGGYKLRLYIHDDGDTGFSLGQDTDLTTGVAKDFYDFIGRETNGIPFSTFNDADVYNISSLTLEDSSVITNLEEGMTVSITVSLENLGGDLGNAAEIGIFKTDGMTGVNGGSLIGAPAFLDGTWRDNSFTVQIPEAGEYAVYIQGNRETDYTLTLMVDAGTQGDRYVTPREQNVYIEVGGGVVDWFDTFDTELEAFDAASLGFAGLDQEILNLTIDAVQQGFDDANVVVNVSLNTRDFFGEDFTTVFLVNNHGEINGYGGLLGIASTLDPMNANEDDEAIVFARSFAGLFRAGDYEGLADAFSGVILHEVGHTLGLRHHRGGTDDPGVMFGATLPWLDEDAQLGDAWFLGTENEVQLLAWIFDEDID